MRKPSDAERRRSPNKAVAFHALELAGGAGQRRPDRIYREKTYRKTVWRPIFFGYRKVLSVYVSVGVLRRNSLKGVAVFTPNVLQ